MIDQAGLIDLWEEINADPGYAHLRTPGIRLVPGVGADRPKAFVIGEAPGAVENTTGKPFTGPCKVIHQLMALAGLYVDPEVLYKNPDQETVPRIASVELQANAWLTNTVKYRPPGNRTPSVGEIMDARDYLRKEWELVGRPKLIVCVGRVAAQGIGQLGPYPHHGDIFPLGGRSGKASAWVTFQYHPAFGLRGDDKRKEMIERHWENLGENIEALREELEWDD